MNSRLRRLSRASLEALRDGLLGGRLQPPFSARGLHDVVSAEHLEETSEALNAWWRDGMKPSHIGQALALLLEERNEVQAIADCVQLVWSPSDLDLVDSRDTAVVVQELFRTARHSVDIVTYAIDQGEKAKTIFGELAERMDAYPALRVRVFVNIPRPFRDETSESILRSDFAAKFKARIWPGKRLPLVYYDPRSLKPSSKENAVLHAKIIVADRQHCLITSANFTEAAQERNIEAGCLVENVSLATKVSTQLEQMIAAGHFQRFTL
jgi:phosphatidylserine/phosphatidylglycerophosphate/cardiolipin synthase-like enzyme